MMNKELSRFLHSDSQHKINIISLGTTILQKNKAKGSGGVECIFRVCQDGVKHLAEKMQNRIVRTKSLKDFKRFLMRKYHDVKDLEDEQMKATLDRLSIGCFVVVYEAEDGSVEPTVMHRFTGNLSSMI
jgi:hypothetical protein